MNSLSVFEFKANKVRTLLFCGEPWFVAKDLCQILEIRNVPDAVSRLDDDEKNTVALTDGTPGNPNVTIVSESGMYSLVLGSRKSEAKVFKKWVTSVVLPAIRKTGSYSLPSIPQSSGALSIDLIKEAGEAILSTAGLHPNLIAGAVANAIAREYPQLQGVVEGYKKSLPLSVQEVLLTATELALLLSEKTGLPAKSAIAVNKMLEQAGLQKRNPESKNPRWIPVGQGNEFGQLVLETAKGRDKTVQALKWYPSVVDLLAAIAN